MSFLTCKVTWHSRILFQKMEEEWHVTMKFSQITRSNSFTILNVSYNLSRFSSIIELSYFLQFSLDTILWFLTYTSVSLQQHLQIGLQLFLKWFLTTKMLTNWISREKLKLAFFSFVPSYCRTSSSQKKKRQVKGFNSTCCSRISWS